MSRQTATRHPDAVHDTVGDATGWLLVLFDRERARIFEAAPEGIIEWTQLMAREEASNPERRWKGVGSPDGGHAQHVAAGSHVEGHRAEILKELARRVAAVVDDHLIRHPDARILVAGPVRDRVVFVAACSPQVSRKVAAQLAIPMTSTLPEVAAHFRSAVHSG